MSEDSAEEQTERSIEGKGPRVVSSRDDPDHGDTDASPKPDPKARRIKEVAAATACG